MKHIKITEPGYAKFNGHFGTVEFKGGVSVAPVTTPEAARLAALIRVQPYGEETDEKVDTKVTFASAAPTRQVQPKYETETDKALAQKKWTREELEAVADKHGIKGVREIASAMGITGKSINELVGAILGA